MGQFATFATNKEDKVDSVKQLMLGGVAGLTPTTWTMELREDEPRITFDILPLGLPQIIIIPEEKFTIAEEQSAQRKTITRDEARQAVMDLFTQRKELDYGEIMSELGLDLNTTIEVCRELEKEKKVEAITK